MRVTKMSLSDKVTYNCDGKLKMPKNKHKKSLKDKTLRDKWCRLGDRQG